MDVEMEPGQEKQVDLNSVLSELENKSFLKLDADKQQAAKEAVSTLLSEIPASEYSNVLNGESFSTAQRMAVAEFVRNEAMRLSIALNRIFTYRDVGERIGVSRVSVGRYASGKTDQPRLDVLEKLSNLYEEHREKIDALDDEQS